MIEGEQTQAEASQNMAEGEQLEPND